MQITLSPSPTSASIVLQPSNPSSANRTPPFPVASEAETSPSLEIERRTVEIYGQTLDKMLQLPFRERASRQFPSEFHPDSLIRPPQLLKALNSLDEKEGRNRLHKAIARNSVEDVITFLSLGADPNCLTEGAIHQLPIELALEQNNASLINILLDWGAFFPPKDKLWSFFRHTKKLNMPHSCQLMSQHFLRGYSTGTNREGLKQKYLNLLDEMKGTFPGEFPLRAASHQDLELSVDNALVRTLLEDNIEEVRQVFDPENSFGEQEVLHAVLRPDPLNFTPGILAGMLCNDPMIQTILSCLEVLTNSEGYDELITAFIPDMLMGAIMARNSHRVTEIIDSAAFKPIHLCSYGLGAEFLETAVSLGALECARVIADSRVKWLNLKRQLGLQIFLNRNRDQQCHLKCSEYYLILFMLKLYLDMQFGDENEQYTMGLHRLLKHIELDDEYSLDYQHQGRRRGTSMVFEAWQFLSFANKLDPQVYRDRFSSMEQALVSFRQCLRQLPPDALFPFFAVRGDWDPKDMGFRDAFEVFEGYSRHFYDNLNFSPEFKDIQRRQFLHMTQERSGWSLAHFAVESGSLAMLKWVHEELGLPICSTSKAMKTPLDLAMTLQAVFPSKAMENVIAYLNKKAPQTTEVVESPDIGNMPSFDLASFQEERRVEEVGNRVLLPSVPQSLSVEDYCHQLEWIEDILRTRGEIVADQTLTKLPIEFRKGDIERPENLIAALETFDEEGNNFLHRAIQRQSPWMVEYLVALGANPQAPTKEPFKYTPKELATFLQLPKRDYPSLFPKLD